MTSRRRTEKKKKHVETRLIVGIEDMILLTPVSDSSIMENLNERLQSEAIYSNIGHVLVVCNPYKWINIYGEDMMRSYVHQQRN